MGSHVLIIGCGYIGRRVALLARNAGLDVVAMSRHPLNDGELLERGVVPFRADLDDPVSLAELPTRRAIVFYLAPPPGGGHTDPRMRAFLCSIKAGDEPKRVVYMSTSGVYGDCGDQVVTEETRVNPQTSRARRRPSPPASTTTWSLPPVSLNRYREKAARSKVKSMA